MYWSQIQQDQRSCLSGETLGHAESDTKPTNISINESVCQLNSYDISTSNSNLRKCMQEPKWINRQSRLRGQTDDIWQRGGTIQGPYVGSGSAAFSLPTPQSRRVRPTGRLCLEDHVPPTGFRLQARFRATTVTRVCWLEVTLVTIVNIVRVFG